MTDDLSCDLDAMDAQLSTGSRVEPPSAWHQRRALRLTASDVATAMAVLGELDIDRLTEEQRHEASKVKAGAGRGLPFIVARKAGLRAQKAKRRDVDGYREQEILAAWADELREGRASSRLRDIDPDTITHSSSVPSWVWPLRDQHSDHLAASLDAWALRYWSDGHVPDVVIDVKRVATTRAPSASGWPQLTAQCAVTGARMGVLLCGIGWWGESERGSIEAYVVEPTAAEIAQVRDVARRFCALVESARRGGG